MESDGSVDVHEDGQGAQWVSRKMTYALRYIRCAGRKIAPCLLPPHRIEPSMATAPDGAGGGPPPDGRVPGRTPSPGFDPQYLEFRTPSNSLETPAERPRYLRKKIVSLIGYAVCLFTGMMPAFYRLECMHIVPRSLQRTHWVMVCRSYFMWRAHLNFLQYFCFREAIGIMINGERSLNLDTSGNCDLGMSV